jgi:hypothetical protein
VECIYCKRGFKNKGAQFSHQPYCKQNPNCKKKVISPNAGAKKGSTPWNKGLPTTQSVKEKISISLIGKCKGIALSPEKELKRRIKISETMKRNSNSGGLRKGSGRGKKGWFKGYWCDSTWELAWVIYNIEIGTKFERNKIGFKYIYNNKEHTYYPDFESNGKFIEIKGRRNYFGLSEKEKMKIDSFEGELVILFEPDMQTILDYVIEKYGKNYHDLYEK